ncbi:MAG: LysR family transcriptional regulator [Myxococcales bacterium]|nr:LysR family transcriptional regulator [Myxococcales bacterium]
MRKNDLDELAAAEAFLQVVATRGFGRAAKALGRSASSVSRAVAELERSLGAQLLVRTTRRVHLTEAGTLYASHAEALLAASRVARDAVAELTGGVVRGRLRVTMPVSVGERLLGPHVPELRRRHPELQLEVDLSDRHQPLVQGGFDLAIRVGRLGDSSRRAQRLGRVPTRLVASPAFLAAHEGGPATPGDVERLPCLTVAPLPGPVEWPFYRGEERFGATVEGIVHTTSPTLAAQLAREGLGLLRIVAWVVREELARGDLVEVLPGWTCDDPRVGGLPVNVLYAQGAGVEPPLKSRVFVAFVQEVLARADVVTGPPPAAR